MIKALPLAESKPLTMPWKKTIAMGRAFELLREDALAHLRYVQKAIGFKYCRFHGLFHDDMAVAVRKAGGKIGYQWHQVDKVLDALRGMGLRPFVELGPMPAALASGSKTIFAWKMNVTPPRCWQEWSELVGAFTRHVIDRYGLEEVRQWYFEVWNEPNLDGFWAGTQEEYWKLYNCAANEIKRVDADLRVGGPATAHAAWIPEFLAYCRESQTPVDFVTTHSYPQDEFVLYPDGNSSSEPGAYLKDVYRRVQDEVRAIAPSLEIHWTEWNPLSASPEGKVDWVSNATVDNAYGGAFVARHSIEADGLCDSMAYWTASDIFEELGLPHAPYSGTYGLLNIQGIPKATFNAMVMVNRMRGSRLGIETASALPRGCGVVVTRTEESIRALLWNCPRPGDPASVLWSDSLSLPSLFGRSLLITTRLGTGSGSAYETWTALGRPQNLSPIEEDLLRSHAQPAMGFEVLSCSGATLEIPFALNVNQVLSMEIRAAGKPGADKGSNLHDVATWGADMGEAAKALS